MEENVFEKVAENNNVSENEVRQEISLALSLADGLKTDGQENLEDIIAVLARRVVEAMEV